MKNKEYTPINITMIVCTIILAIIFFKVLVLSDMHLLYKIPFFISYGLWCFGCGMTFWAINEGKKNEK